MILALALALLFQAEPAAAPATPPPASSNPGQAPVEQPAAGQTDTDEDWGVSDYLNNPTAASIEAQRAAANRAAIERAEAAGRDVNAPPSAYETQASGRCRSTPNGFVCGSSERARQKSEALLNNMLNKPD
ncbi:MAG: hypothetical protein KF842_14560 [Caulobacter sp.]|nr:hypothetical protein [Caulobacter sp.]